MLTGGRETTLPSASPAVAPVTPGLVSTPQLPHLRTTGRGRMAAVQRPFNTSAAQRTGHPKLRRPGRARAYLVSSALGY